MGTLTMQQQFPLFDEGTSNQTFLPLGIRHEAPFTGEYSTREVRPMYVDAI